MTPPQPKLSSLLLALLLFPACIAPQGTDPAAVQSLGHDSRTDGLVPGHSFQPDLPISTPPFETMHANWKQRIDQPYVFVEFIGSYTETGRLLPAVHRSMIDLGIVPSGPPFVLWFDDPGNTPVERLRSRACYPVAEFVQTRDSLLFEVLPSTTVVYAFVSGPYPEVPQAYPGLYRFMGANGWTENGPIRETYLVAPGTVDSFDALITEVQIPVTYAP